MASFFCAFKSLVYFELIFVKSGVTEFRMFTFLDYYSIFDRWNGVKS